MSSIELRGELFGSLFILVQHLSRRADEQLESLGLTSRQWLLLAVIQKGFPGEHPTLTEAAERYGSSRQNVTQVARALERRGWLRMVPDVADRRATRLVLTDRIAAFADPAFEARTITFLDAVFGGAADEELARLHRFVLALTTRLAGDPIDVAGGAT